MQKFKVGEKVMVANKVSLFYGRIGRVSSYDPKWNHCYTVKLSSHGPMAFTPNELKKKSRWRFF